MRRSTTALLVSLLLPFTLPTPAMADDIRHGPVIYGTGDAHQHGPVHYGNGPDDREAPGRYRTRSYRSHSRDAEPERRDDAPLIIVEPRIELEHHRRRPRSPLRRSPPPDPRSGT
ncbi:hypothetical protein [Halomonas getboli]|uniref:hypothetical protein n=1 Tax=Halomonas getboli TaxID=2935862 RepID=UPI001FFFC41E|nr:hypothetical protein [Halomonas getboli]MCK2183876.1 hypothetical protein [Halomonas getboli]